jgi:hypothetical protein
MVTIDSFHAKIIICVGFNAQNRAHISNSGNSTSLGRDAMYRARFLPKIIILFSTTDFRIRVNVVLKTHRMYVGVHIFFNLFRLIRYRMNKNKKMSAIPK